MTIELLDVIGEYLIKQSLTDLETEKPDQTLALIMVELINITNSYEDNHVNEQVNSTIFWLFDIVYT